MHGSRAIAIALEELALTGRFGGIPVGIGLEELSSQFPPPDDKSVCGRIWCYGNIEFHCIDGRLAMIFSDHLGQLSGGVSLTLDPWVFNESPPISLDKYCGLLSARKLDHGVRFEERTDQAVVSVENSGFECRFEWNTETQGGRFVASAICQRLRDAV